MKPKKEELKQNLKECRMCKKRIKNPVATLILRGRKKQFELNFCSYECLETDQIIQTIDFLMNHSNKELADKFNELTESRLKVLEKNDKRMVVKDKVLE